MVDRKLTTEAPLSRVVVLGGSGFIGSRVAAHLTQQRVPVRTVSSAEIDLTDESASTRLAHVIAPEDAVLFASCLTPEKGQDPSTFMRNVMMAKSVCQFLDQDRCAHLIYLSSDAVYSGNLSLIREDSACDPSSLYGLSHVAREALLRYSTAKTDVPFLVLRPCAVYGPGDTHSSYGPNRFLRTAISGHEIALFGKGEEKRDHLFIDDLCRLIELALRSRATGILNVATGTAYTFREVAVEVIALVADGVVVKELPRRSPITHRHFDIAATVQAFPQFRFHDLAHGLRKTVGRMLEVSAP